MAVDVIFKEVIYNGSDYLIRFIYNLANNKYNEENKKKIWNNVTQCIA